MKTYLKHLTLLFKIQCVLNLFFFNFNLQYRGDYRIAKIVSWGLLKRAFHCEMQFTVDAWNCLDCLKGSN